MLYFKGMRTLFATLLLVSLAACGSGKDGGTETAALTSPICKDVLSCAQWCNTTFKTSQTCIQYNTGDNVALCPPNVDTSGWSVNPISILTNLGCQMGMSPKACQDALSPEIQQKCLDQPFSKVLGPS